MVDQQELSSAGLKFMDFAIRFFNMAKCQYQQQNLPRSDYLSCSETPAPPYRAAYYEFSG